jgi:hypothetical protein
MIQRKLRTRMEAEGVFSHGYYHRRLRYMINSICKYRPTSIPVSTPSTTPGTYLSSEETSTEWQGMLDGNFASFLKAIGILLQKVPCQRCRRSGSTKLSAAADYEERR